ncbi:Erythroid differentiation-related factor 1 [Dichanthelium oligosanthes]|uniref:Erythroid differentiation-related factor 1 n=1 Tax=Dichanthelium oligosanthes TaxID=888268 RepID=A0A1E5WK26_9POAL|nr:Erythroid differentiation-related factor 1 [Dichanthelium oligosanthes]
MDAPGELQCVGRLEVAAPPPARYVRVGSLPVPTDSSASLPALLPSPSPTGAPRYQMLPLETDLNTLPMIPNIPEKVFPNDAKSTEGIRYDSGLFNQNLSRKCEALAVSGLAEYEDIDVIAPADILKQIFKIPYSKAQVSVAVNRIGNTLILNTGPDVDEGEKIFRRQNNQPKGSDPSIFLNFAMHSVRAEACDCPPSHQPSQEKQTASTVLRGPFGCREGSFDSPTSSSFSTSPYLDQNDNKSRNVPHCTHESLYLGARKNKQKAKGSDPIKKSTRVGEKTRCEVQESEKSKRVGNNGFRKVCFWDFHNFHMLLGSDLLIFSNEKYVAVSLHLWDVSRQVTPLNWLEAWLDNVMASVPELAICYHQNGVVQGYELLKNDDIFLLKGVSDDGTPAFHPQVVQQNGLAVLSFLQENCKQDPGAYWLYKGAEEDVIQLYNLSILPEKHTAGDHRSPCGPMPSFINKGRKESLFSLGTLLYRVAHRMSLSKVPGNKAKCAQFFRKCLDFLSEQDHLVVRACAHEQFARLILKCYEELELTSESFMIESEVTLTDLDDDSPELRLENLPSKENVLPEIGRNESAVLDDMLECSPSASSCTTDSLVEPSNVDDGSSSSVTKENACVDSLVMCQTGISKTIADAISSKLAAIHHVSQAIKSLRWNRQLQNTQDSCSDSADTIWERSVDFSLCRCGDVDCIEVCDIREWLPKSKMDHKLWKLVLLLGESYLALGEAYKNDGQLQRTLKVVELACLVYGSMPGHLDGDEFISSMSNSSLSREDVGLKTKLVLDEAGYCKNTKWLPPNYLFWAKAWMLVGDVYAEYHRLSGHQAKVVPQKSHGEVRMSNEVALEVKRLKRKLGKDKQNCGTCSLINCSCQSDRASSGSSASSSSPEASTLYGRKKNKKSLGRNLQSHYKETNENPTAQEAVQGSEKRKHSVNDTCIENNSVSNDVNHYNHARENQSRNVDGVPDKSNTSAPIVRDGGIFKFLDGPKPGDIEYNLSSAIRCYGAAKGALFAYPVHSAETSTVLKKRGWAFNELGRSRLESRDMGGAEIAFADAIGAFQEVFDHTNVILINCNLGHGRRALAEECVSRIDEFQKYDLPEGTYMQSFKSAKSDYFQAINYYSAAKRQLKYVNTEVDKVLYHEVYTQYAHTYLRLGMLLARESFLTDSYEGGPVDDSYNRAVLEISASDAFREALSTYESFGEHRKQETSFGHFQLACYQRDLCLRFLDLVDKEVKQKNEDKYRQKSKWYGSLAEKNWQKALEFYGPKTHPTMFLNILMAQSALSINISNSFHSTVMLETALGHLLEGRQVVEANEDYSDDVDLDIKPKFWSQLQSLLKRMLAASLPSSAGRGASIGQASTSNSGEVAKLKEMYRLSLKSSSLGQLHALHKLWVS